MSRKNKTTFKRPIRVPLKNLYEQEKKDVFTAVVGYRFFCVNRGKQRIPQRVLLNVTNTDGTIFVDHLQMADGQELPDDPDIYGKIVPGAYLTFEGKAFPYRRSDGSKDYGLRMTRLIKSEMGVVSEVLI